jgi:surface polysaccharide O-acyltransferase-like enzyme
VFDGRPTLTGCGDMTRDIGRTPGADRARGFLASVAILATVIGAVGSVVLTLYAGRHNKSSALIALFAVWVLSPFLGLGVAIRHLTKRWSAPMSVAFRATAMGIAIGCLAVYGVVALAPPPQMAFYFLVTPLGSWLAIGAMATLASLVSRRDSRS